MSDHDYEPALRRYVRALRGLAQTNSERLLTGDISKMASAQEELRIARGLFEQAVLDGSLNEGGDT
jgi:hypothetical protein